MSVKRPLQHPLFLHEVRMANVSYAIRSKPGWTTKISDPIIKAKWREEALAETFGYLDECKLARLTEKMVDWVFAELDVLKAAQEQEPGGVPSCFDGIFESFGRIPSSLRKRLLSGVAKLEDVPADQQDWHPGSDNQVLDLVHPSLFPIIYKTTKTISGDLLRKPRGQGVLSKRFCWLPTDYEVSVDGETVKAKSYINNLHPKDHQDLYKTIEEVLALCLPLLSNAIARPLNKRINVPIDFGEVYFPNGAPQSFKWYDEEEASNYYDNQPETFSLDHRQRKLEDLYQFGGKTIQVITKLANIHLTPAKPSYPGGTWHLEGMCNENIVASAIYYYDSDNVTESHLAFRSAYDSDHLEHVLSQDDVRGARVIFGAERGEPCVQSLGAARTSEGVILAWPNGYQHQVQPFALVDKEKPGHRKILAFFLVHPEHPIPSTTTVPPQQFDWALRDLEESKKNTSTTLPQEIWAQIEDELKSRFIQMDQAKALRKELMAERTSVMFNNQNDYFA
ncbi:hypothetical protein T439DRAFT_368008 [Meredithblackwellia eburnea MCA 4105]